MKKDKKRINKPDEEHQRPRIEHLSVWVLNPQ